MADPTTKEELLAQVRAQYTALEEAIAPVLPAQMGVPGVNGAWSVTDELAHLTFWHHNLLARFHGATSNQVASDSALDDDAWNLHCLLANRGRAPADVLADLWRAQQATLDGIAALPEALLFATGAHGGALWEAVDGTVLGHYPEHVAQIARWRAQHVTPPTTKADLLFRIADGYAALTATLDAVPPRELALPALHGGWAIKDEVAHLTFWESRVVTVMEAVLAGAEPPFSPLVGDTAKIDAMNAAAFAATRQQPLDDVFADAARTHTAYVRAVTDLPDDVLFDAHRFPWMNGEPLAAAVATDTYEHYPEHIWNIQRWRAVESTRGFAR